MVGATISHTVTRVALSILSVSSTDRWSVQHALRGNVGRCENFFQYPLRIDGRCNVELLQDGNNQYYCFQYPLRIDGRCNSVDANGFLTAVLNFQYPLRIDGRCNLAGGRDYSRFSDTFSILYGSMVGATPTGHSSHTDTDRLSVSSTDRWSVQPTLLAPHSGV